MKPLRYSAVARRELSEAIEYYESQRAKLGSDFRDEYLAAVERVRAYPGIWTFAKEPIRRCMLHRFPYAIYDVDNPQHILILGVLHLRRDPTSWTKRA